MIAIDELKLNKFQMVAIPSNKDLFRRVGSRNPSPIVGSDDVIPMNMRTIDQLEYMDKYDSYMQSVEQSSDDSESDSHNSAKNVESPEES